MQWCMWLANTDLSFTCIVSLDHLINPWSKNEQCAHFSGEEIKSERKFPRPHRYCLLGSDHGFEHHLPELTCLRTFSAASYIFAWTETDTHVPYTHHAFTQMPHALNLAAETRHQADFTFSLAVMPSTLNSIDIWPLIWANALPFTKHFHVH